MLAGLHVTLSNFVATFVRRRLAPYTGTPAAPWVNYMATALRRRLALFKAPVNTFYANSASSWRLLRIIVESGNGLQRARSEYRCRPVSFSS